MTAARAWQMVHQPEQAEVMLHPVRTRIMGLLAEPDSAAGLARQLGIPRQRVNYHLRELENRGLIEFVEARRRGNCMERIVRATARSYVIDPGVLGSLATDPDKIADKFSSAYLVAVAARTIQEVAAMRERADRAQMKLPTFTLLTEVRFSSAEKQAGFTQELTDAIARLVVKYHDAASERGRKFQFFCGAYPVILKSEVPETRAGKEQDDEGKRDGDGDAHD